MREVARAWSFLHTWEGYCLPFKDRQRQRDYDREYQQTHKEQLQAYRRRYRELNREEIAENKKREIRLSIDHTERQYLGTVGMTRKQREKFQKELNDGPTE